MRLRMRIRSERTILPDPNLTYEALENMDFYTDSLELLMNMAW